VLNVLFGRGKSVGDPLTGHPKVRMVSLTGRLPPAPILSAIPPSIKRTHMELGGKAPVIVFDDADIDAVVEGVRTFGFIMPAGLHRRLPHLCPAGDLRRWWRSWARPWPA
jgi:aminobutyraldehyde dehydrogenase